jgi:hypothetical protein
MMEWLLDGGQLVAGITLIALLWVALRYVGGDGSKPLSAFRFVALPSVFLLWAVAGFILIFNGIGLI